jgi:hypothetical protein
MGEGGSGAITLRIFVLDPVARWFRRGLRRRDRLGGLGELPGHGPLLAQSFFKKNIAGFTI